MAYTALYRKFRPVTFSEIVGQEHITKTLRNQIAIGRVGHAYLFNGGRGTGKTSAAKILARAINCLNPQDGEPCNKCETCKAAITGSLTDIVEMDAASNNSVEDIRQIRDEVNFLPTLAKYRVYIIDEVHMLSTGAFNALLKTLEEPPSHVKFILATTEPQKLPATILSRCQRFDFKKISNENIEKRLKYVCEESGIEITKEALKVIAVLAEGAMRDALSILERCIQDGETKIDEDKIKDLVGIPKLTYIHKIVEAVVEYNVENAIYSLNEVINDGKDVQYLIWEIIKYVKDILVYKTSKTLDLYNDEEKEKIEKIEKNITKERLLNIIYELSNLENEIKWSTQKTIMLQVGIIKLCNIQEGTSQNESGNIESPKVSLLERRIVQLEEKINNINVKDIHTKLQNVENSKKEPEKIAPKQTLALGEKLKTWSNILTQLKSEGKMNIYSRLCGTTASKVSDMIIGIEFPEGLNAITKNLLEMPENMSEIEKKVSIECGNPMRIKFIDTKEVKVIHKEESPIQELAQNMDLPLDIIE